MFLWFAANVIAYRKQLYIYFGSIAEFYGFLSNQDEPISTTI